jgi:hypothetical protein
MGLLLLVLLSRCLCVVKKTTFADLTNVNTSRYTFVLFTSSDFYEYARHREAFVFAAQQSQIDANFLVLDMSTENLSLMDLKVPLVPVVLCRDSGRWIQSPLTRETMLTFFNQHVIGRVPYITTEEDLQHFFDTAGFGLLAAFRNASDDTIPALALMNEEHFNEITVAYCDPQLTGREAFFIFRFNDNALFNVQGSLFGLRSDEIEGVLARYSVPEILKADMSVIPYLERGLVKLIFLVFDTRGAFYLGADQLVLAKEVKLRCDMTVLYETSLSPSVSATRYGFPSVRGSELRLIDLEADPPAKYIMRQELTADNAGDFCQAVKEGRGARYFRSEPVPAIQDATIERVVGDNVLAFVQKGFVALGVFDTDDASLAPLVAAKKQLVAKGVMIGEFGLAFNDWPGEPVVLRELPRLLLFNGGKIVANMKLPGQADLVFREVMQIWRSVDREL